MAGCEAVASLAQRQARGRAVPLQFGPKSRKVRSKCCAPPTFMTSSDKLADPPIVEAVLEVRFTAPELEEVVVGRLSDLPLWRGSHKTRLPPADIPAPIRAANPMLLHMPTVEIRNVGAINAVRIGSNVLTLHFYRPYAGWETIYPVLQDVIDAAFAGVPTLQVARLGLRYINVFTKSRHHVGSVSDLTLRVEVARSVLTEPINLTFTSDSAQFTCTTRVASRPYLMGAFDGDASAAVDIDVTTPNGYSVALPQAVKTWIDEAHTREKQAFRRLLPDDLFLKLRSTENVRSA